jgi:hypothetical protein
VTEVEEIEDVVCLAVPAKIDPTNPAIAAVIPSMLTSMAEASIGLQYTGRRAPDKIELDQIDWLITSNREDVEKFQPAHDCAACRAGNDQALAFLRENPGRFIAMGNMKYRETWL